jgi:hypothetical protein
MSRLESACGNAPGAAAIKGGRAPRAKGSRFERAIVRLLQEAGIGSERVPLSGSAGGRYSGDLSAPGCGRDLVVEAKSRGSGFKQLYAWLIGRDALAIRSDRQDILFIVRLPLAAEIALKAESSK